MSQKNMAIDAGPQIRWFQMSPARNNMAAAIVQQIIFRRPPAIRARCAISIRA